VGKRALKYKPTEMIMADVMMKPLPYEKHRIHANKMGVKRYEGF